jgi:dihydrofolate reductase
MITIIAAAGENNELGKDNDLVWHLPDDFKRFKQLTTNHHIIMGRKTFESFPKPLPNRTHVVITRNSEYKKEGAIITNSMKSALEIARDDSEIFIIGGGEIYTLGLSFATKIELTRVHANFEVDTYFPDIPLEDWTLTNEVFHEKDERHQHAFTYQTYVRK